MNLLCSKPDVLSVLWNIFFYISFQWYLSLWNRPSHADLHGKQMCIEWAFPVSVILDSSKSEICQMCTECQGVFRIMAVKHSLSILVILNTLGVCTCDPLCCSGSIHHLVVHLPKNQDDSALVLFSMKPKLFSWQNRNLSWLAAAAGDRKNTTAHGQSQKNKYLIEAMCCIFI